MKAIEILIHSIRQVLGNLGVALQISAVLFLIQIGLIFALGVSGVILGGQDPRTLPPAFAWAMFAALIVNIVTALWIAVAWHRFVLNNERPTGLLPTFRGDRIASYFGHSILVALVIMPVLLIIVILIMPLLYQFIMRAPEPKMWQITLGMLVIYLPLAALLTRLSVILPAAALGTPMRLGEAWGKTSGTMLTMGILAVLVIGGGLLIDLPATLLFPTGSYLQMIWLILTYWIKVMVGLSILTTIYGHYVEGRPLVTQAA